VNKNKKILIIVTIISVFFLGCTGSISPETSESTALTTPTPTSTPKTDEKISELLKKEGKPAEGLRLEFRLKPGYEEYIQYRVHVDWNYPYTRIYLSHIFITEKEAEMILKTEHYAKQCYFEHCSPYCPETDYILKGPRKDDLSKWTTLKPPKEGVVYLLIAIGSEGGPQCDFSYQLYKITIPSCKPTTI